MLLLCACGDTTARRDPADPDAEVTDEATRSVWQRLATAPDSSRQSSLAEALGRLGIGPPPYWTRRSDEMSKRSKSSTAIIQFNIVVTPRNAETRSRSSRLERLAGILRAAGGRMSVVAPTRAAA